MAMVTHPFTRQTPGSMTMSLSERGLKFLALEKWTKRKTTISFSIRSTELSETTSPLVITNRIQ